MSLLSKNEVMKELDISQATYYRYVNQGMPTDSNSPNMYDLDKIYEWLEKRSNVSRYDLELGQLYTHEDIALMMRVDVHGKVRLTDHSLSFALITDNTEWFGRTVRPELDELTCRSLSSNKKPHVFNHDPEGLRYMGYGKLVKEPNNKWSIEMIDLYVPSNLTLDNFDYDKPHRIMQIPVHLKIEE